MPRALIVTLGLSLLMACPETSDSGDGFSDADADFENTCFALGCFDEDPCTEDRCMDTGLCVFVPMEPENACLQDSHCDLGNPCVIGRCEVNGCDLQRCTFEHVPNCIPCGPMFGSCFDSNPCTPDVCDEATSMCQPKEPELECDSRCSPNSAMSANEAMWFGVGFEGSFIGTLTTHEESCEVGCECDVKAHLVDFTVPGPMLIDDETGLPLTCRLSTCGATRTVDCGSYVHGREYVVWGLTMLAGSEKDAAGAPRAIDVSPPPDQPDALRVKAMCPSGRFTEAGIMGPLRGTLVSGDDTAVLHFVPTGFEAGTTYAMADCEGCDHLPFQTATLQLTPESDSLRATLFWSDGNAQALLYPTEAGYVADLLTQDGTVFGHITLDPAP